MNNTNNGKPESNNISNNANSNEMNGSKTNDPNFCNVQPNQIHSGPLSSTNVNNTQHMNFSEGRSNHSDGVMSSKDSRSNPDKESLTRQIGGASNERNPTCDMAPQVTHINNQKNSQKISRIPLVIKGNHRSSEIGSGSAISKERLQGAIRKQTKMETPISNKKTNIPTKIKIGKAQKFGGSDNKSASTSPNNVTSGDIINDVLYISSPLKTQSIGPSTSSDQSKAGVVNCKEENLQSFQLIAPDNFMIYQALSVNHNIDSTKPLEQKISDLKKDLESTSNEELSARKIDNASDNNNSSDDKNVNKFTSPSSSQQHSLEEVEQSNITNGNGVFLPNETGGRHGNNQRKDSRQFNSGKYIKILNIKVYGSLYIVWRRKIILPNIQILFPDDNLRPVQKTIPSGVSDIMGRLEEAITTGNHKEAASLAKEVSKLQISTKLAQQESSKSQKPAPTKQEKIKYVKLNYR